MRSNIICFFLITKILLRIGTYNITINNYRSNDQKIFITNYNMIWCFLDLRKHLNELSLSFFHYRSTKE